MRRTIETLLVVSFTVLTAACGSRPGATPAEMEARMNASEAKIRQEAQLHAEVDDSAKSIGFKQ